MGVTKYLVVRVHDPAVTELEREVAALEDEVYQLTLERDVPKATFNKKSLEARRKRADLALARSNISRVTVKPEHVTPVPSDANPTPLMAKQTAPKLAEQEPGRA